MEELQSFDVNTGEVKENPADVSQGDAPKKSNKKLIIGIVIVAAVLLAGVVLYFVLINTKGKIPSALIKTFGDLEHQNKVIEALDISELVANQKYTVRFDVDTSVPEVGDTSVTAALTVNKDVAELSGDVDISYIPTIEFTIQLDENELRATCPMIPDRLFIFDYKGQNKGYIDEFVSSDVINEGLAEVYENFFDDENLLSFADEITNLVEEYKDIEFEDIDDKEYTIDGKEVMCQGYKTHLNKRVINNMLPGFSGIFNEVKGMDIELYIYKDELAAVKFMPEDVDEDFELCFEGGDYRLQNISLLINGKEEGRFESKITGNVETASISGPLGEIISYEYDFGEGELTVDIPGFDSVNAKLIRDERKFSFELDYIDIGDTYLGASIAITPDAKLSDMSGEEFDLGNATEEEFDELIDEIKDTVQGLLGQ